MIVVIIDDTPAPPVVINPTPPVVEEEAEIELPGEFITEEAVVAETPVVEKAPVEEALVEEAPLVEETPAATPAPVEEAAVVEETPTEIVIDEIIFERTTVPESQVPFPTPAAPSAGTLVNELFSQPPAQPRATPNPVEVAAPVTASINIEPSGAATNNAVLVLLVAALVLTIGFWVFLAGGIRNDKEEELHSNV